MNKLFWGDEYVHFLNYNDGFRGLYAKTYQTVHFKYIQFIACHLYLNKGVENVFQCIFIFYRENIFFKNIFLKNIFSL